ncbi:hypothetical protein D3C77_31630 [compost metagenome]
MCFAGHGGALEALAHGAVHADQWHRADELGGVGALPGRLQQGSHFPGADPFGAGQARTVFHDQVRCGDALLRQPLAYDPLCRSGVVTVGIGTKLRAKAQEQLLGHGVVTVLVDVADDLNQIRREGAGQQAGALRYGIDPVTALDGAPQLAPNRAYCAGGITWVVEQRQVSLRVAAITQLTADYDGNAIGLGHRVVAHVALALLAVHRFDLVVDANVGNRRLDRYQHLATVIAGDKAQRLEVDQQGVGLDQERFVFVTTVIIELRQYRLDKVAAVEYQVTADGLYPIGAQVAHQQPEFFHVQLRVTPTF